MQKTLGSGVDRFPKEVVSDGKGGFVAKRPRYPNTTVVDGRKRRPRPWQQLGLTDFFWSCLGLLLLGLVICMVAYALWGGRTGG